MTNPLDPLKRPPRGPSPLQNPIYPLFTPWTPWTHSLKKNFEILGGLFDPLPEKKVRDIYDFAIDRINEIYFHDHFD